MSQSFIAMASDELARLVREAVKAELEAAGVTPTFGASITASMGSTRVSEVIK